MPLDKRCNKAAIGINISTLMGESGPMFDGVAVGAQPLQVGHDVVQAVTVDMVDFEDVGNLGVSASDAGHRSDTPRVPSSVGVLGAAFRALRNPSTEVGAVFSLGLRRRPTEDIATRLARFFYRSGLTEGLGVAFSRAVFRSVLSHGGYGEGSAADPTLDPVARFGFVMSPLANPGAEPERVLPIGGDLHFLAAVFAWEDLRALA